MKKQSNLFISLIAGMLLATSLEGSVLLDTINKERKARGLRPLKERSELACAATRQALDIGTRKLCTHTGRDGSNTGGRIKDCGLWTSGWGEIIACGQKTPQEAVRAWIKSPPHSTIMFSKTYSYFDGSMSQNYWVVVFSK